MILARRRGVADPADERRSGTGGLAFGDLIEARHTRVGTGGDCALVASDAVDADGVDAAFVGLVVGHEPDRVGIAFDGLAQESLRGLFLGHARDFLVFQQQRLEVRQHTGHRGAADQVDRAGRSGSGDTAPRACLAREDVDQLSRREVGERVRFVRDDADPVLGDRVEDETCGIAGKRVTGDVGDRHAAGGDVVDAYLGATLGDLEFDFAGVQFHVLLRQQAERAGRKRSHR